MSLVQAGLAAASVGASIFGGLKAKDEAEKAAREQAKLTFGMRQRQIQQMGLAAGRELGAGRAVVGASNIQFSGSARRYLNALDMENMREMAWARQAARAERQAIRAGASGVGQSMFFQAAGDLIGYAAQAYANRAIPMTDAQVDSALGAEQWDFTE